MPISKTPFARIGKLDLGRGLFRSEATLSRPPVGIGRDREGQLYAVDYKNNLVRIDLTKPSPIGPAVDVFTSLATGEFYLMDTGYPLDSPDPNLLCRPFCGFCAAN